MVKYGKLYRELQLEEFKGNYIDYKKLKQKIKIIQNSLPESGSNDISMRMTTNQNKKLITTISSSFDENDIQDNDKYQALVNEFTNLLNEEFQKCYKFFKSVRKKLHIKLNNHLYTQTNYTTYNLEQFLEEINNIRNTIYLSKCLNEFINDNMNALKKILKKFDKKFSIYFGNIGPKYILENLSNENSDME